MNRQSGCRLIPGWISGTRTRSVVQISMALLVWIRNGGSNMELPASVPKSDELIECLKMEEVIDDALRKINKRRGAYYDQKIMDELLKW
ncbi:hypothetical protein FIV22_08110 [Lactiplantibacillus plantarum]|nr:hypothetical protein [Lactiplantibacillus plantarum]